MVMAYMCDSLDCKRDNSKREMVIELNICGTLYSMWITLLSTRILLFLCEGQRSLVVNRSESLKTDNSDGAELQYDYLHT